MFHSILVGVDGSALADAAIDAGMWLAGVTRAHLTLIHLHARKLPLMRVESEADAQARLDEKAKRCQAANVPCRTKLVRGWGTHALVEESRWHDMIVVGKTGESHPSHQHACGSVTSVLLQESPIPVVVVDDRTTLPAPVLVAFDGTPDACRALRLAAVLSTERQLPLRIVGEPRPIAHAREYLDDWEIAADVAELTGRKDELIDEVRDRGIGLAFVPALAGPVIGASLSRRLVTDTQAWVCIPMGRVPQVI